jgi:hypothetical protein
VRRICGRAKVFRIQTGHQVLFFLQDQDKGEKENKNKRKRRTEEFRPAGPDKEEDNMIISLSPSASASVLLPAGPSTSVVCIQRTSM